MTKQKLNTLEAFKRINLPELHHGAKLELIPDKCFHKKHVSFIADEIKDFVQNGHNLLLWGNFGTGKSACASILLKAALSKGIFGFWTSYEEYINAVMNDLYYSETQTFQDRCRESPFLVVDELIVRDRSKEKEVMLEILIRHRLEKRRATVITTNHSMEWLDKNHKSFYSLFNGHYSILQASGHDFRSQ